MNFIITPFSLLLLFSASVGLFASSGLLIRARSIKREYWSLALIMIGLVWILTQYLLALSDSHLLSPRIYFLNYALCFAFGPLLLFYVKELTGDRIKSMRWLGLHMVPSIVIGLVLVNVLSQTNIELLNKLASQSPSGAFLIFMVISGACLGHLLIYLISSTKVLKKYASRLRLEYSSLDKVSLKWLNTLVFLILLVILTAILYYALLMLGYVFIARTAVNVFATSGLAFITLVLAFKSNHITRAEFQLSAEIKPQRGNREISKLLREHLKKVMQTEKPHLNPELRLKDLSEISSIKHHQLSELINESFGCNFFDFVNQYRIDEVKECLKKKKRGESILSIALESGFNSKSAFNRAFKKQEGLSPTAYLKMLGD